MSRAKLNYLYGYYFVLKKFLIKYLFLQGAYIFNFYEEFTKLKKIL